MWGPPPPPPFTQADTTANYSRPHYEIPTRSSSSPPSYNTMSNLELKHFLECRGVAFDDILDRETLCRLVWDTHWDLMDVVGLKKYLLQNLISMAGCRDVNSLRQRVKDTFCPPTRPAPPPASVDTSQVRRWKGDHVVLSGLLNSAELNGKRGTVESVDYASGRVQVRIEEMDQSFKVKFKNLHFLILLCIDW